MDDVEFDRVEASSEVWGAAPRNIYNSDFRAVKAYIGSIPATKTGYEFLTEIEPESFGPGTVRWHERMEGVEEADQDHVRIPAQITKIQRSLDG